MTTRLLKLRRVVLLGCAVLLAGSSAFAEVTKVDIQRRDEVLGGKSFGSAGPYEKVVGRVYFA